MIQRSSPYDLEFRNAVRQKARDLIAAFLDRQRGAIETARNLIALRDDLGDECQASLGIFIAIDSETDALPVGPERQHWNTEALLAKDAEIAAAEQHWNDAARRAAKDLLTLLEPL